ncbi:extracellular solute-binding protein [Mobilitalea sibirica]|uniref:Extracellular solute-binding protein n=1 Tax=Mobilitalea sibirica TaxID=1462919 RepID=A0A8J7L0F6_9FIRM|nr:extracellular solute-binding protein [Mobilitalea sibirica]MBH1942258.1 extracellular solute-binding protein [Mobilitalea sibirica]
MKSKFIGKKRIIIVASCILSVAAIVMTLLFMQKQKEELNTDKKSIANASDESIGEDKLIKETDQKPIDRTRFIHIYTVDRELRNIINEYAKENWDFDYSINFYTDEIVYGSNDITNLASDKLVNDPSSIDMYCVPAYAQQDFIKGELSDYACTYKDLGIDVDTALVKSDIPQFVIDYGTNPEGEIIVLPYLSTVSVFMYRRSVAKEVWGSDDPSEIASILGGGTEDWDDFKQAALTLKEHGYYIVPGFKDLRYVIDESFSIGSDGAINPKWVEYMDLSNYLYEKGCIKDTDAWTEQWYMDLDGVGDKIFGFITLADIYYSLIQDNTAGDWAICMPPYKTVCNINTGILVNKNSPNKDILGPLIEWITLDSSETGLQYRLATGTFSREEKLSVISGTVLKKADSSRDLLGGQNINPIIYEVLNSPFYQRDENFEITNDFYQWENAIKAYISGEKDKETTIKEFELANGSKLLPGPEPNQDGVIVWKSKDFERAIRNILRKPNSDIYLSDVSQISELYLEGKNLDSLEDIVHFNNLKHLYCNDNKISDISSIKVLSGLETLNLCDNKIKDISSLKELMNLKELFLIDNEINDINCLKGLTALKYLYLGQNDIKDISSLTELTNLDMLDLSQNEISKIDSLQDLTKLSHLVLSDNIIDDISALKELKNLKKLYINHNKISDISSLESLVNLETLCINNNNISDIKDLGGLNNLRFLVLDHNKISDVSSLSNLQNLYSLEVKYNKIKDISNFKGIKNLEHLDLSNNEIEDISSLSEFTGLGSLFLADNKITDISVISELNDLKSLALPGNEIKDKSPAKHVMYVTWYHEVKPPY